MGLFFNLPKHRVFNYQPVFYDPKKEDLDARIAKAEREKAEAEGKEKEPYVPGEYIKRNFRSNYEKGKKVSGKENVNRIIRIIGILLVLVLLFYFIDGFSLFFGK